MPVTDRFGMALSTGSAAAAEEWQQGVDKLLSQNYGPELQFARAIELDEGFAMAHCCLAYWYQQKARPEDAKRASKRALALAPGVSRRERQQIEAVDFWINGKGRNSIQLIKEHLAEFHRDGLLMRLAHRLYMLGCSGAGSSNFPPEYLALLRQVEPYCRDDWAFLAEYAFAHHETGQLDEARRLAQLSLDMNQTNAVACHSMTHVFFEQGDSASGEDFLGGSHDSETMIVVAHGVGQGEFHALVLLDGLIELPGNVARRGLEVKDGVEHQLKR